MTDELVIPEGKYLGKLCKRGHDWNGTGMSLRNVKNDRSCVLCEREAKKKYRDNNRKKINEAERVRYKNNSQSARSRYINNKDAILKRSKEYYKNNKDRVLERHKIYSIKNSAKIRETKKIYHKANKSQIYLKSRKYALEHPQKIKEYKNKSLRKSRAELGDCYLKYNIVLFLKSRGVKISHKDIPQRLIDMKRDGIIETRRIKALKKEIENEQA